MSSELRHVRLERARDPDHPAGDPASGYDIVAAFDDQDRLDPAGCAAAGDRCRIRRFEGDHTVAAGRLVHGPGGRWTLDLPGDDDDRSGFRFGEERFRPGEYVGLIDPSGRDVTYVVARSVTV